MVGTGAMGYSGDGGPANDADIQTAIDVYSLPTAITIACARSPLRTARSARLQETGWEFRNVTEEARRTPDWPTPALSRSTSRAWSTLRSPVLAVFVGLGWTGKLALMQGRDLMATRAMGLSKSNREGFQHARLAYNGMCRGEFDLSTSSTCPKNINNNNLSVDTMKSLVKRIAIARGDSLVTAAVRECPRDCRLRPMEFVKPQRISYSKCFGPRGWRPADPARWQRHSKGSICSGKGSRGY